MKIDDEDRLDDDELLAQMRCDHFEITVSFRVHGHLLPQHHSARRNRHDLQRPRAHSADFGGAT